MKRIGRYELVEQIGRGGMGTVYRARDPELGREVALKLLERGSEQQRARFRREAEGLARLRHPNVVRVHEIGEEGERCFLVMELVEGEDLERRVERDGPLDPEEAAEIGRDLARALAAAHALGILHRDLKPANVLWSEGRPLLTDFGLAHLGDAARLTRSGASLGTPGYWPPEQATGKRERLGPASDVYGLGATLYALLSGSPPFRCDTIRELLVATCEERPASLRPRVPAALDGIVLRCLEKAPEDRFEDGGALADALDAYLAGEAVAMPRRVPVGIAVAGVVAIAAFGFAFSGGGEPPAPSAPTPSPTASSKLPAAIHDALAAAVADPAPYRWTAAEAAMSGTSLDRAALEELIRRGGARLVVLHHYRGGRLSDALAVARAGSVGDSWCGRAYRALETVEAARRAFGATLRIFADMSRPKAPRPPPDGLLPHWKTLEAALAKRGELSTRLGGLRDGVRAELRATGVGAAYLLNGPARDNAQEREAFTAFRARLDRILTEERRPYDRLDELEDRLTSNRWERVPSDPDVVEAERVLKSVPGPAAEVLRVGALCLLARDKGRKEGARIAAARRAARLCVGHEDRPLGLSVRLRRAWRFLTASVVKAVWKAIREQQPVPYRLDRLEEELGVIRAYGARAMVLLCLGRVEDAAAIGRSKGSLLDAAIQVQVHLVRGEAAQALAVIEAQSESSRKRSFGSAEAHARTLLGQPARLDSPGRGLANWFPWHTPAALPKVVSGQWWWPGRRFSGG